MKDDLGGWLKSEIFNAFLSLHSDDVTRPTRPAADCLFASVDEPRGVKRADGGQPRLATQVEVHARREVPAEIPDEVAAITEPILEVAELEPAAAEAPAFGFELHDTKVIRGRELAMITSPDADVTAPPPPKPARRETARRAPALRRGVVELERAAAALNVKLESGVEFKSLAPEQLRRQLEEIQTFHLDADTTRTWTKVLKVKRTAPKPAPAAPAPASRAACPTTRAPAASSIRPVACGPSAVETFYASE